MIYVYDLLFILLYLTVRLFFKNIHDEKVDTWMMIRESASWVELSVILIAMYFMPPHTISEKAVSFFMCLVTKAAFSYLTRSKKHYLK